MHGSSSVPQEWAATIREYGGEFDETYGVPVEEIFEAFGCRGRASKLRLVPLERKVHRYRVSEH